MYIHIIYIYIHSSILSLINTDNIDNNNANSNNGDRSNNE